MKGFPLSCDDLQLIPARIAHIESLCSRNGTRIGDYFDPSLAKFLFGASEVIDFETHVSRTQRTICLFDGKMQLILADLIPGADLAGCCRFRHLSKAKYRSIKVFSGRFESRRHRDIYMMKSSDHGTRVRSPSVSEGNVKGISSLSVCASSRALPYGRASDTRFDSWPQSPLLPEAVLHAKCPPIASSSLPGIY